METRSYLVHALSPVHAGTGQSVELIDLPISRMRSTGIPIIPGSSIKGVLRDTRTTGSNACPSDEVMAIFGPAFGDDPGAHAGALVVSDARLLALPIRSFRGTFAWVTSPLLLALAQRDCVGINGMPARVPAVEGNTGAVASVDEREGSLIVHGTGTTARLYLEDLDVPVLANQHVREWADFLAPNVAAADVSIFTRRFTVVGDEVMTFLWETATQVDTRVRIDPSTRTVSNRALWVEESLPSETLLIGLLAAERSRRRGINLSPADVLRRVLPDEAVLQFGGKATVGRGRCRMLPLAA